MAKPTYTDADVRIGDTTTEADATDLLAWLRREMRPQDPDEAHVQD